jgi:hypothetical protein
MSCGMAACMRCRVEPGGRGLEWRRRWRKRKGPAARARQPAGPATTRRAATASLSPSSEPQRPKKKGALNMLAHLPDMIYPPPLPHPFPAKQPPTPPLAPHSPSPTIRRRRPPTPKRLLAEVNLFAPGRPSSRPARLSRRARAAKSCLFLDCTARRGGAWLRLNEKRPRKQTRRKVAQE